jgi:kinesin family protein 6/9
MFQTAMIATMSGEVDNFNESISTCSFAGRVASIKNKAEINEEVDPKLIIRRLKQQIQEMKEELTVLRGEKIYRSGPLSAEEKERCMQLVQNFLATGNTAAKKGGEEDETGLFSLLFSAHLSCFDFTCRRFSFRRLAGR